MDSFELNKIAGGVIATVLFVMVVHAVSQEIYSAREPEKPAFAVATAEPPTPAAPAAAGAAPATPAAPAAPAPAPVV